MKTTSNITRNSNNSTQPSLTSKLSQIGLTLTMAATFLCGLTASATSRTAPEQGFTIPVNVQIPIVLKTQQDASCDLHEAGDTDAAHSLKLYANGDGYVKVHVKPQQESRDDARLQLDCRAGGKLTRYPLRFRAASSPTDDMPAPLTVMPIPKGSKVLPALTEEDAQRFSDEDLISLGYPRRPDAATAPDQYAKWLEMISRPITVLPPHSVNRPGVSHQPHNNKQPGGNNCSSSNWSGFVADHSLRSYVGVEGEWYVPQISKGEWYTETYSATWAGLDGYNLSELVQAGTEQNSYLDVFGLFTSYSAWTELLPNQPYEQGINLSINPGDQIWDYVYIGDSKGNVNQHGGYAWFNVFDFTTGHYSITSTSFNGTFYNGSEAEWIVERPTVNGTCAELSDYGAVLISEAQAENIQGNPWSPYGAIQNVQITMYNDYVNHNDNDLLSEVWYDNSTTMTFGWFNFH